MIGTQGYAPPEQYRGRAEARSDLYALGATMHHALSGRDPAAEPPFSFPKLRTLCPDLNPALPIWSIRRWNTTSCIGWPMRSNSRSVCSRSSPAPRPRRSMDRRPGHRLSGKPQMRLPLGSGAPRDEIRARRCHGYFAQRRCLLSVVPPQHSRGFAILFILWGGGCEYPRLQRGRQRGFGDDGASGANLSIEPELLAQRRSASKLASPRGAIRVRCGSSSP